MFTTSHYCYFNDSKHYAAGAIVPCFRHGEARAERATALTAGDLTPRALKVHQRGAQWKQGVAIYMTLYTSFIIQCYPNPLHPPPTAPPCTPGLRYKIPVFSDPDPGKS